jgi:tetratricopeptide (TPR) repeat protein
MKNWLGVSGALLCAILESGCARSAAEYVASADRYVEAKQYREAIVEYRNALKAEPQLGLVRLRLADAYMQVQDTGNAAREYVQAAALLPKHVDAQLRAATMLVLVRRFEDARVCAEKALAVEPRNVTAQVLHANALAGLQKFDVAMAEIQQAIELDPTRGALYTNLGGVQFARGDRAGAGEALKKATEVDPKSPDAQVALANFHWAEGRLPEAEAGFQRALQLNATHVPASRALAAFYLGSNRAAEAERYLRSLAENTKSPSARLALADYYIALKRTDDAIRTLNQAADHPDGYAEARSRLATIEFDAGRAVEANRLIDETLVKDPTHPRALLTKARFLIAERRVDDALVRAKQAVAADSQSIPAHYMLASIHSARQDLDEATKEFNEILRLSPSAVAPMIELARLNLIRGQSTVATQFAQQAVDARPENLRARLLLLRTLIAKGEVVSAEKELGPLTARFPKSAELHWLAGAVHLAKRQTPAARRSFELALQLQPDALEPLYALVAMDIADRAPDRARQLVEPRLAARPNDIALLVLMARVREASGDAAGMETLLRKAIQVDASNRQPYEMLGRLYLSQKRLDEAAGEFEEVVKRDPRAVGAFTMMGMIRQVQNRIPEARERYQRALDVDPQSVVAANNLAWLHATTGGNMEAALQLAQAAKARAPNEPSVNHTLGWVYLQRNLPALAIPLLRLCVESDAKNGTYQYHLGLAYAKNGDTVAARQALSTAITLPLDAPSVADARKVLASLR